MTPIGPPPEPGGKSGRSKLSKNQKIALTVVLSTMFVPVMFIAPIFCRGVLTNWFWQLMSGIPAALLQPLAMAVGFIGFAVPCGLFARIISRVWLRVSAYLCPWSACCSWKTLAISELHNPQGLVAAVHSGQLQGTRAGPSDPACSQSAQSRRCGIWSEQPDAVAINAVAYRSRTSREESY